MKQSRSECQPGRSWVVGCVCQVATSSGSGSQIHLIWSYQMRASTPGTICTVLAMNGSLGELLHGLKLNATSILHKGGVVTGPISTDCPQSEFTWKLNGEPPVSSGTTMPWRNFDPV